MDKYPKAEPDTKRFKTNVKVYRALDGGAQPPTSNPSSAELNRTNWALKRVGIKTNGDFWDGITGNPAAKWGDTSYSITGKNVDIVVLEGGAGANESAYAGYHTHPEWDDLDNPGTTRIIPMDWPNTEGPSNSQVTSNIALNSHSVGTLGVSCGLQGGFAKKAKGRAMFLGDGDGITACIDSLKTWHNAKPTNSATGLKDPTILVTEWHHPPTNNEFAIKIEDIDSVTDPDGGTTNKPGGGWGSDLTPFCLLYTSPSPRDLSTSRMPSSA